MPFVTAPEEGLQVANDGKPRSEFKKKKFNFENHVFLWKDLTQFFLVAKVSRRTYVTHISPNTGPSQASLSEN